VFGDVTRFVPAGDARIEVDTVEDGAAARVTVKGAGETVTITGWSSSPVAALYAGGAPGAVGVVSPAAEEDDPAAALEVNHDSSTGIWAVSVDVPSRGWATIDVRV
jgi:hypothetical protein